MNYPEIKNKLTILLYNSVKIDVFTSYLKFLETEKDKDGVLKNKWFSYLKEEVAINLFEKVAKDGVFIDGETITLSFRGKIIVSYNYQAYKNMVLNVYPETKFDIQLVYEGDDFEFKKVDGRVLYSHDLANPFKRKETNKVLIGAYCVIKNSRGEFLETIDLDDINKMKASAKTKTIWDAWFSQMVMKSIIKRACKIHFKDIITNADALDNENNDPERVVIPEEIQRKIEAAKTEAELTEIYNTYINTVGSNKPILISLLSEKKKEILK